MNIREQIKWKAKAAVVNAVECYIEDINIDDYLNESDIYTMTRRKIYEDLDLESLVDDAITNAVSSTIDDILDEELIDNIEDWVEEATEVLLELE